MAKILLAEEDQDMCFTLDRILNEAGQKVEALNEQTRIVNDQIEIPRSFYPWSANSNIDGLALSKFLKLNSKRKTFLLS
jgi:hypothetical protein